MGASVDPVSHISDYPSDFKVETELHSWGIAVANLEEAHEDLCRLYERSGFVVVGEACERLRTTIYMLTGA